MQVPHNGGGTLNMPAFHQLWVGWAVSDFTVWLSECKCTVQRLDGMSPSRTQLPKARLHSPTGIPLTPFILPLNGF